MTSVNLLDENLLLWNKFRNGDADAFGELMHAHYQDLFNYGTRFTKDTGLVKDCIQDLFLALWINRLTVSETSFVKYDLLRSLRHNLTRAISRSRRAIEPQFDDRLNSPLAGLSRRQQEVIYLRFHMDAYAEDIAGIMSLSRQSVQNLLHDGLRRLRKGRKFIFTNVNRRL